MRLRIAGIAVLLGVFATGLCWLTLQPTIAFLFDALHRLAPTASHELAAQVRSVLPFYLVLDLGVLTVLSYVVLQLTVGRPLRKTEEAIDQLSRLDLDVSLGSGGPLLSRLQRAVQRMTEALQSERALTRKQLAELQSANQKLGRAQTELVASDRLATVGKLAAGVAHEVGNPLAGILGYLSLLRSRAKANVIADTPELVDRIEAEVHRIDHIVRSLLDLGRPSRAKAAPIQLLPLIDSSLKLLWAGSDLGDVKTEVLCDASTVVIAEPGPVSQVLINLLLNSAQAMAGIGKIFITADQVDRHILLKIRDTGPGLPPNVVEHLFEPFFTTKAAGKGTGLGLAVSRHMLQTMGGDLVAENHSTGGAQFTIRLPAPQR